jgi:nucleoside-diphosphate-sugar epimerase
MKQVLYMSSASVYRRDDGVDPYPITLYGVWKLAMEGAARCYFEDHGIASVGYRPLVVYGPSRDMGISAGPSVAIESAVRGIPYTISFSGRTNLIYVEDVVSAYVEADVNGARTYTITGESAEMTQ